MDYKRKKKKSAFSEWIELAAFISVYAIYACFVFSLSFLKTIFGKKSILCKSGCIASSHLCYGKIHKNVLVHLFAGS